MTKASKSSYKVYKTQLHISKPAQAHFLYTCMAATAQIKNLYISVQFGLLDAKKRCYPKGIGFKDASKEERDRFYISGYEFEKTYNHVIKGTKAMQKQAWWQEVPQKTRKDAMMTAERAFHDWFDVKQPLKGAPRYKSSRYARNCYFDSVSIQRDRVRIPKLGWVRLSEYGYIPTTDRLREDGYHVTGVYVSYVAGKYYIAVRTNEPRHVEALRVPKTKPLGIDMGVKQFVTTNSAVQLANCWQHDTANHHYQHLQNYLHRWEKRFNRRTSDLRKREGLGVRGRLNPRVTTMRRERARSQMLKWRRRLANIKENMIRQTVSQLVKLNPQSITVETLNVKGMKANSKLAPAIQQLGMYRFKQWLMWECKKHNVQLRAVDQWYPSTKCCSNCGRYDREEFGNGLKDLAVRTLHCASCGYVVDRDLNACQNLAKATKVTILNERAEITGDMVI